MTKGERIEDHEWLLRRGYFPHNKHIRKDFTIADTAFQPSAKDNLQLSVNLESLSSYEDTISNPLKFRICKIQALDAHQIGLECIYDPIDASEDQKENIAHVLIRGFQEDDLILPGLLARRAVLVPHPDL